MATPDREQARGILNEVWKEISDEDGQADYQEVNAAVRARIAELLKSERVSFTYSLPTQLLGKVTNPQLDALCLQRGENEEAQWDPRSFAVSVIVPWVGENENVLGTSQDPYVSNPLRQARVVPNPPNVRPNTLPLWEALHEILSDVEGRNSPDYTLAVLREVLRQTHEILKSRQFSYPRLTRTSLEHTLFLVRKLLESSREGEHGMSLATALFKVIGRRFDLWDEVARLASTTADRASGMTGDLECRKHGELVYAVEVKERTIRLADVIAFDEKLSRSRLTEALINAPGVYSSEAEGVRNRIRLMWGRGINLYNATIEELVSVTMGLAGEDGRLEFITEIGNQLDEFARPSGKAAWRDLLKSILDGTEPS
ncbi:MAG: restriction endonuclease, SacI family [Gammaproteobacteria bacterium]|nr:restriction endonuclease, SacI family [Gammaproteobacteria bacterium]